MRAVSCVEKSGKLGVSLGFPACNVRLSPLDWDFKGNDQIADLYSDFDSPLELLNSDGH
jgi:hypothetical protein